MKTVMNKTLLAAALTASLGIVSSNVMAVAFPDFTVDEGSVPGSLPNVFVADKITGNYVEVATFDPSGNFAVSIKWNAGQFVANDGATPVLSQLNSFGPTGYGMYALFQGMGTFATSSGVTTFTFNPGVGNLGVYIDPLNNTTFTAPSNGSSPWTTGLTIEDYLIATGTPQSGFGTLDPTLPTCNGGGINCGSFGTTTSFALTTTTPGGTTYFTVPNPFYNLSFQSGQLNNFTPTGTQTINGSLDVVFGNTPGQVPEPATLALLGLGLIGMGAVARRRKAA